MRCNVLVLRKTEIRFRAGGDCHPHTLHPTDTDTHIHMQHRGSSVLVGGLRSGPPHSTDKCLAPARPQSAFTGQQIRTGGHTPNPFTLQSVYLRVCVCGGGVQERNHSAKLKCEVNYTVDFGISVLKPHPDKTSHTHTQYTVCSYKCAHTFSRPCLTGAHVSG